MRSSRERHEPLRQAEREVVDKEFALKDILNVLFKRKWTVLLIFFSFTVAMLVGNSLTPLEYEATRDTADSEDPR